MSTIRYLGLDRSQQSGAVLSVEQFELLLPELAGLPSRFRKPWTVAHRGLCRARFAPSERQANALSIHQTIAPSKIVLEEQIYACAPEHARTARCGAARCVYIGRQTPWLGLRRSKWANKYKSPRDGTVEEVVEKYRAWLLSKPELVAALPELRGRDLACWCAPDRCHGEVLLRLANGTGQARS